MNILNIKNLSKIYPNGVKALNDVTLTLQNGMFGLLGANGAGKSSLMRTIATLQEPSSGSIYFNGTDVIGTPGEIRRQLGYLPQEFGVYPKISAQSLMEHIAVLKGISHKKDREEHVAALLQQTNLYAHRKKAVYNFSGGMRQRFGIAQALLGNPQLVIVDEPTAGLDPEERNRFLNLLSEIGENMIVILSTHIVEDVYDLCPDMGILAGGQLIARGNPLDLVKSLENKIWHKTIARQALPEYTSRLNVISTKLVSGKTQVHVLSDVQPDTGFEPVYPDLEDVYFSTRFNHPASKTI